MPGNKRWNFELRDGAIYVLREGKEVANKKEQPLGPVKEVFYGAEHPQAKTFKPQAIEVNIRMYIVSSADLRVDTTSSLLNPAG